VLGIFSKKWWKKVLIGIYEYESITYEIRKVCPATPTLSATATMTGYYSYQSVPVITIEKVCKFLIIVFKTKVYLFPLVGGWRLGFYTCGFV
jgi:hypothetical protein